MTKRIKKSQVKSQKSEILAFFKSSTERPHTLTDLYNHLDVYDEQDKMFVKLMIEDLMDDGKLKSAGRSRYTVPSAEDRVASSEYQETSAEGTEDRTQSSKLNPHPSKLTPHSSSLIGKVDFVNPNFGFIRYDDEQSDIYVSKDDMNGALDGDTVKVRITKPARKGDKNPEGEVVEVLTRGRNNIVGKIRVFANYALVSPDVKGFHENVFIPKDKIFGATSDDLVIVDITAFPENGVQAAGVVTAVLGKSGDNNAEMHAIMAEFGLPVEFPKTVLEEAKNISEVITEEEISKRRDMRGVLTFTIDPHDAKDFDDAISFKILENGNYEIGVHIADVSHYVTPKSKLEEEAFRRATSVYLVDRTIPMLPEKLSNNLCSLRPHEDKLVFSAVFEMDKEAKVVNEWFGRCVIHSDQRFSYEDAQEILEGKPDETYAPVLNELNALAHILREQRFKKGAFNFETNEVKFNLDETGKPTGIYQKIRKDAHKLIEEFMLLANKQVATFVHNKAPKGQEPYTMVYRVHEPPNPTKVETFAKFAAKMGFTVKTGSTDLLAKSLNNLMFEIEGKPIQNVLESLAVRTMSKAKYSTQNLGHFGLAFDHYSHFTSPIRRYPDVMAHRMLQHYLDGGKSLNAVDFEEKCKHSSDQEKLAAEAERASIKYKQVEYMSFQSRNEVFSGLVSGVTDFGIFVEIDNMGAEGMVRLADLNDDYYEFDAENYRVTGRKTGKIIGFGNEVKVKVKTTDIERRSIELELISVAGKEVKVSRNTKKSSHRGGGGKSKNKGRRKR
jgi:ribonuclease R